MHPAVGIIAGLALHKLEEPMSDLVLANLREATSAWPVHKHMDYFRPDTYVNCFKN